ncbi:MAG TPA: YceI family protein [Bacteroidales bacterium]|jgi:polyisoprenoid-binding protein YceI|nr:YceI family protein [Bacteroidales bacterium]
MKRLFFLLIITGFFIQSYGQKYITKNGYIGFFSHTPVEDIKADNNQVASVLDISTGEIVFQVLIRSFRFEKALMEQHFNENYMESEKHPRATFTGKITNLPAVSFSSPGVYEVEVEGDLTIHGTVKKVKEKGAIGVAGESITASSKFSIDPEDYNIKIPNVVRNKIAKTIEITVIMKYSTSGNQ